MTVYTLLPNAEQSFQDANGVPYAGGSVYFYIPSTTTPKATFLDADGVTANPNPIILDSAGRAIIYGSGQYRQILKDSLGNVIWDQLTQDVYSLISQGTAIWGGTATGTANAILLTSTPLITELATGQLIAFIASDANTGAATVNVSGIGIENIKVNGSGGVSDLVANQILAGDRYFMVYDGTQFILINPSVTQTNQSFQNLASASTTDLGSLGTTNINVTGTVTITSFGSSAVISNPLYFVTFSGALQITQSANILTPNGQNLFTQAGDWALIQYLGSGVWNIISYFPASGYIGKINIQVFTGAGTYTYTSSNNLLYAETEILGGGGGGGGATSGGAFAGGGGSGAYAKILFLSSQIGSSQSVVVGAAGAGGAAGFNNGGNASASSIGSLATCNGGFGGGGSGGGIGYVPGGAGGTSSISAGMVIYTFAGQTGQYSFISTTGGVSGGGASNPLGFGGQGIGSGNFAPASPAIVVAVGYGSGGSGGTGLGSTSAGGNGTDGIVVIKEYLLR